MGYIRYADDTHSEKELQHQVDKVEIESEKLRLQLHVKRTYSLVFTKKKDKPKCALKTK